MKYRTDFVTNSSSSSFTAIKLSSKLLENWIQENPVKYSGYYQQLADEEYRSLAPLFHAITEDLNTNDCEVDLNKREGIVDNIVSILCGGNEENEEFGSLAPLIDYMKAHREEIEKESNGIIVTASQFEGDIPTVEAIKHELGRSRFMILDLENAEEDEADEDEADEEEKYEDDEDQEFYGDLYNVEEYSEELILDALEKYGQYFN